MAKIDIGQKLQAALNNAALLKRAGLEEVSTDSAGKEEHGADAAALQDGTAAGVTDANVTAEGKEQPGGTSDVMKSTPTEATASTIAPTTNNEEEEPAKEKLDASDGKVVADDLKEIEKQANIIKDAAKEIVDFLSSDAFRKQASEQMEKSMNIETSEQALGMLEKLASDGDVAAQQILDYRASFFAGMQKKANDVEALVGEGASPEDIAAAEDALNQAAMEDPYAIMEDAGEAEAAGEAEEKEGEEEKEEGEEMAEDITDEDLEAIGAQAEEAAQELVLDYADEIINANPEIQPEEALQMAQEEVADAVATVVLQQQAGDVDEEGNPVMSDEELSEAAGEMVKSASAHPDRDALCDYINKQIGLDPSAFAKRLGF